MLARHSEFPCLQATPYGSDESSLMRRSVQYGVTERESVRSDEYELQVHLVSNARVDSLVPHRFAQDCVGAVTHHAEGDIDSSSRLGIELICESGRFLQFEAIGHEVR